MTWTKGHATEEDIKGGKTSHEEKARNIAANKLATEGIAMNQRDAIMVKAARQRKTLTALQQTNLVKIWLNRQDLAAIDQAEQQQQQLDEEAAAIAEMQEAFEEKKGPRNMPTEAEEKEERRDKEGRGPWQYVKIKVLAY